jgi:hypothetical protein
MRNSVQTKKPNVVAFPTREPPADAAEIKQAQYEQFFDNALSVIYDDKSLPQIIESLKGDGDPLDGLVNTAVAVVVWVRDSAEQAGQALPPDVVFQAGIEILEDLADLAGKAGVHEFTPEEVEGATFKAMAAFDEFAADDTGTDAVTPPAEGRAEDDKADAAASAETTDQAAADDDKSDDPADAAAPKDAAETADIWADATPEQKAAFEAADHENQSHRTRASAQNRKIAQLMPAPPSAADKAAEPTAPAGTDEDWERFKDLYREMKGLDGGAARPQIVEDFNQIVALDQAWRLDEVAPVRAERFGRAAAGGR